GAAAGAAVLGALEADALLAPEGRLGEVQLQRIAQVLPGGPLAPEPEQIPEDGVEEVGHPSEIVLRERQVDGAEAIEVRAAVLVAEDGVGQRDLLEALLRG